MKLKAYFLLAALWIAPALAMGPEGVTLETVMNDWGFRYLKEKIEPVINDPRFGVLQQSFAKIGGGIKFDWDGVVLRAAANSRYTWFSYRHYPGLLEKLENERIQFTPYIKGKIKPNVPCLASLQGLCIVKIAQECLKGNREIRKDVKSLPEDLRLEIASLSGMWEDVK